MLTQSITRLLTLRTSLACVALAAVVGAPVRPALADPPAPNFITIEMFLATPSTIVQGEPILLHFKINNSDNVDYTALRGTESKGWYSIKVSDTKGRPVSPRDEAHPLSSLEKFTQKPVTLQSNSYFQGYIVPKPMLVNPGKYTLSVHVRLPYGVDPYTGITTTVPTPDRMTGIYQNDYTFPLTVLPPDAARLQARAGALEKVASDSRSMSWHPALVEELCSISEEQAWPSWQALADDPNATATAKVELAQQMVRLHTNRSVDVLAHLVWESTPRFCDAGSATGFLMDAYTVGGGPVKQHVKDVFAQHGVPFPQNWVRFDF